MGLPKKKNLNLKSGLVTTPNSEIIIESPSRSEVDNPKNKNGTPQSSRNKRTRKTTTAVNEVNKLNTDELIVKKKTRKSKLNLAESEVVKKRKTRKLEAEKSV